MEKIQLLIKHAKVFNSYLKKFIDADVSVKDENSTILTESTKICLMRSIQSMQMGNT